MALMESIATAILGGNAQERAAEKAAKIQRKNYLDTVRISSPELQTRNSALIQLADLLGIPRPEIDAITLGGGKGGVTIPGAGGGTLPTDTLEALTRTPGYQFRLGEGIKSFENSAAARGGLLSGAAIKGQERFAQDFASNEYGNAINRLLAAAGLGQAGSQNIIGAGNRSSSALSNLALQEGAVRASTYGNINDAITTAEDRLMGALGGGGF